MALALVLTQMAMKREHAQLFEMWVQRWKTAPP
jgi:hypothetical protein